MASVEPPEPELLQAVRAPMATQATATVRSARTGVPHSSDSHLKYGSGLYRTAPTAAQTVSERHRARTPERGAGPVSDDLAGG
ncbi:hypothetical protein Kpho02_35520 [Kitasatospora phosalacinea]|uniref:Uncharacterized protein n=1 Tax=Kitasatospora phosalacinea TaxID=2065 RepID=A0A9W6V2H4_9ACTN|nr:hypothetical protein Kpho02_35520 [Kitasatospora phosalacinea]